MAKLKTKLLMKPGVQEFITPFGRVPNPQKWVFLVGCYNSGTTLLSEILAQHPAISALPVEGINLSDSWPRPETEGWNRMWCRCLDEMSLANIGDKAALANRVKKQWSFSFADRPVLLEKSIPNSARLPFIAEYFPPAYIIYIVRNGYAVAEGLRRNSRPLKWGNTQFGEKYPIELCAEQWAATDRIISRDRTCINHMLDIDYESFCANPREVLDKITAFIDLEPLAEKVLQQSFKIHGVQSTVKNMNKEAIARLSSQDLDIIGETASDVLEKYKYRA